MNKSRNTLNLSGGINLRIVAAFERIAQALKIMAWSKGKSLLLNPSQSQVLIFLLLHQHLQIKVSTLSKEFQVSIASMSDTIRVLEEKQLLHKVQALQGGRNFLLSLTVQGKQIAERASGYTVTLQNIVANLEPTTQEQLLESLAHVISGLYQNGITPVQRMCKTCRFHYHRNREPYCQLLQKPLAPAEIQIDCADHVQQTPFQKPFD